MLHGTTLINGRSRRLSHPVTGMGRAARRRRLRDGPLPGVRRAHTIPVSLAAHFAADFSRHCLYRLYFTTDRAVVKHFKRTLAAFFRCCPGCAVPHIRFFSPFFRKTVAGTRKIYYTVYLTVPLAQFTGNRTNNMKTSDFNYELPPELIAQTPIQRRDASRLLVLDKNTGAWQHRHFYDLPEYLRPGDCLILNNSRVLPARLLGHRLPGAAPARYCCSLTGVKRPGSAWCVPASVCVPGPSCPSATES